MQSTMMISKYGESCRFSPYQAISDYMEHLQSQIDQHLVAKPHICSKTIPPTSGEAKTELRGRLRWKGRISLLDRLSLYHKRWQNRQAGNSQADVNCSHQGVVVDEQYLFESVS